MKPKTAVIINFFVCFIFTLIIIFQIKNKECENNNNYKFNDVCYFDISKKIKEKAYGQYLLNNGNIYVGFIEDGKPNGEGICKERNTKHVYKGIFNNGIFIK